MTAWLLRRLLQGAVTLVVVTVLLFFLMRVAPGDPLARYAADRVATPEEMAQLRARFGLDQPVGSQFASFLSGVARGDLGISIAHYPDGVGALIVRRLPASVLLGATVLLVNFVLGTWLGVLQATRRGSAVDRWLTRLSLAGYSMPSFWLGLILIAFVSIRWGLLPASGMTDLMLGPESPWPARAADIARHLVLPALTLSIVSLAATMQYQRTAMLEVLRLDFIRAAQARGLPPRTVTWRHAWRNALTPMLTLLGLWIPLLVTGSVFVESVFNWPGIGALAAEAIGGRDYPLLLGTAALASTAVILGNLCADLGQYLADPRVRAP